MCAIVMRKPANPFILTGYHSPPYFCNRETELSWLQDQYENERNAVIHSWRRIGKTALLKHFFNNLEKNSKAKCLFVDLLGTTDLLGASKKIAEAVVQKFGDPDSLGKKILKMVSSLGATLGVDEYSGTPQLTFGLGAIHQPMQHSLDVIGQFLSEGQFPIVVCLDEFQQIVNYSDKNSEAIFRTWVQNFPTIRFVFSGSHRNMTISMFSEAARPFYRSAQVLSLDSIEETKYRKFISSFFLSENKKISIEHIERIFRWTRVQTYYVQLTCNKLYGRSTEVTDDLVNEVFEEIIQQEIPVFSSYQSLFTSYQWKVLVAIAKAEYTKNPLSRSFIDAYDLGAASSVKTALKSLESREFVISDLQGLTIQDTLLMRWLQRL